MPGALLRQRFSSTDEEGATSAIQAVLGDGRVSAGPGPFSFEVMSAVDDGVSVTRIASRGSSVRLSTGPSPELVVFAVREGRLALERDGRRAELGRDGLGLVPVGRSATVEWEQATVDAVSIGTASITRLLAPAGRPLRLSDAPLTPRSAALAVLWDRLARVLAGTVLEAPDLYQRDLVRGQMIDALAATTTEAFDLADPDDERVDSDQGLLQAADAYLAEHLGDAVAVGDVARAVGVSPRGLQLLYQRRLGSTPLLRLRRMRLDAARNALHASASTPIGTIARRLGYSNLGRFSAHYREAFGEPPSATPRGPTAEQEGSER